MRGKDNLRSGGEVLVDQLLVNGVRHVFCVPGESYLAALDAFHDRDIAVTVCRQEGGAVMMAEAAGKLTGRPGHRVRDPRPRRHQRLARPAHRQAGFLADDHVRRSGRARDARARGVPGARLPRRVRHDGEMGDRDRRPGAHPGNRLARVSRRDERPARPGGDRAARRHADGARLGRRRARRRHDRDLARPHRHGAAAEDAVGGREAADDPGRQPLVGGRLRRDGALRRAVRHSGDDVVPPPASLSAGASLLRRRSRHRRQSEGGGARESGRSRAAGRRADGRDALARLHAARHPEPEDQVHPRPSGLGRARPRLSAGPRRSTRRRPHSRPRSKGCSRRTKSAGAPRRKPRTTTISPGPSSRPRCRGR